MHPDMKRIAILAALSTAALAAVAYPALAQGEIGTLERGHYVCELPGTAAGDAGIEQPAESFTIESASRYAGPEGSGTYLRRGDTITLTSGPRVGQQYAVISTGFLRKIENGQPGRLRCIKTGRGQQD